MSAFSKLTTAQPEIGPLNEMEAQWRQYFLQESSKQEAFTKIHQALINSRDMINYAIWSRGGCRD